MGVADGLVVQIHWKQWHQDRPFAGFPHPPKNLAREGSALMVSTQKRNEMDNQHRQIKGYRELSQEEIDLMNQIKQKGAELGQLVQALRTTEGLDQRWISIGATDLQTGLMALTRGVAKPTFF